MGLALDVNYDFDWTTCCVCGAPVVMERNVMKERRRTHKSFYCIEGHSLRFTGETKEEQLRKKLEQEEKHHEWTKNALEKEQRSHSATKGKVTKLKNRAAAGVCPCCKRTFQDLAAHMQTKHPDFVKRGKNAGTKEKKKADEKADTDTA